MATAKKKQEFAESMDDGSEQEDDIADCWSDIIDIYKQGTRSQIWCQYKCIVGVQYVFNIHVEMNLCNWGRI